MLLTIIKIQIIKLTHSGTSAHFKHQLWFEILPQISVPPTHLSPQYSKRTNFVRHSADDGGELLLSRERSLPLRMRLETCCSRRCLSCSFSCWFCCCCCSRRRSFSASSCCFFITWSSCWSWEMCTPLVSKQKSIIEKPRWTSAVFILLGWTVLHP